MVFLIAKNIKFKLVGCGQKESFQQQPEELEINIH